MYLIIGGNGYLGRYILKSILEKTSDSIYVTARNIDHLENTDRVIWLKCEITNDNDFNEVVNKVRKITDLKVVFLAAYHHPDLVAEHSQKAWDINVTTLSKCINKLFFARKLLYASTDSVYGNSVNGYHFKEIDQLNPVNIYGKNKAAAESIVRYYGFNVVRYPFLIAPSLVPGKLHFYDKIVDKLKRGESIEMFKDSYRSSLNFKTAADLLVDLCEKPQQIPSILNVCGDESLSKYDIGIKIAQKLGVSSTLVKGISLSEGGNIFKTKRAASTLMDNTAVKEILGLEKINFIL